LAKFDIESGLERHLAQKVANYNAKSLTSFFQQYLSIKVPKSLMEEKATSASKLWQN